MNALSSSSLARPFPFPSTGQSAIEKRQKLSAFTSKLERTTGGVSSGVKVADAPLAADGADASWTRSWMWIRLSRPWLCLTRPTGFSVRDLSRRGSKGGPPDESALPLADAEHTTVMRLPERNDAPEGQVSHRDMAVFVAGVKQRGGG